MKNLFLLSIFFQLLLSSCMNKKNNFENYVNSLEKEINSSKLKKFGRSDFFKETNTLEIVFNEVFISINELPNSNAISLYLDSVSLNDTLKTTYVSIALHRFINNKSIKTVDLINDYNTVAHFRSGKKNELHRAYVKNKVEENNMLYNVGDTISIFFRVDEDFGGKRITYNNMVSDSVYYAFENTVKLKVIIENKSIKENPERNKDSNDLIFSCKILEISSTDVWNSDAKLEQDAKFDLYLYSYGRLLGESSEYSNW